MMGDSTNHLFKLGVFGRVDLNYVNLLIMTVGVSMLITENKIEICSTIRQLSLNQLIDFKLGGAALVASSCPIVLDVLLDFFSKQLSIKSRQCLIGRVLIGLISLVCGIVIVFISPYEYMKVFNFGFFVRYTKLVYFPAFMFCLCTLKPSVFTIQKTASVSSIALLTSCLEYFKNTKLLPWLMIVSGSAFYAWLIGGIVFCAWYIYKLLREMKLLETDSISCLMYIFLCFLTVFLVPLIASIHDCLVYYQICDSDSNGYLHTLFFVHTQIIACIIICILPGHIIRMEKDLINASRQSYMRYMSHELRTPLNSLKMGIEFCISKMYHKPGSKIEKDLRRSLIEMGLAYGAAIEILNEFLLYDKLENGLVSLKKKTVKAIDFISESLEMFTVQIRAKNIKLELNNLCINPENTFVHNNVITTMPFKRKLLKANESTKVDLETMVENSDNLFIDKSKLGQVIRNVMSNAIKFTPDNGRIQVNIQFIKSVDAIDSTIRQNNLLNPHKAMFVDTTCGSSSWFSNIYIISFLSSCFKKVNKSKSVNFNRTDSIFSFDDKQSEYSSNDSFTQLLKLPTCGSSESISTCSGKGTRAATSIEEIIDEKDDELENGILVIEIKDTGVGINKENLSRLFKEIIQFNPEELQNGGGSGLGLWISKSIVDLHEGKLIVHSDGEGKGTSFRLEIPMSRPKSTKSTMSICSSFPNSQDPLNFPNSLIEGAPTIDYNSEDESDAESYAEGKNDENISLSKIPELKKRLKFLVVDDSLINRRMLCRLLRSHGHICDVAADGVIAVNMTKINIESTNMTQRYDVILTDFIMPNLKGPDAISQIRQLGYTGSIIGLTGNTEQKDHKIFLQAGANHVFTKPLEIDQLYKIINL